MGFVKYKFILRDLLIIFLYFRGCDLDVFHDLLAHGLCLALLPYAGTHVLLKLIDRSLRDLLQGVFAAIKVYKIPDLLIQLRIDLLVVYRKGVSFGLQYQRLLDKHIVQYIAFIRGGASAELASLKRFKDDVKEVASSMECGLTIKNFNDLRVGDIVEAYEEEEVKRTL